MSNPTQKIVTPRGELAWVTITGEGKENMSGNMQYLASIIIDPKNVPEHQALLDSIDEFWEDHDSSQASWAP